MFKNISQTVDKKKNSIIRINQRQDSLGVLFDKFLEEFFSKEKKLMDITLDYDADDKKLIIQTNNKIVANEIAFRIKDLTKILKENRLFVSSIIIR